MRRETGPIGWSFTWLCFLLLCALSSGCLSLARPQGDKPASVLQAAQPGEAALPPGHEEIALLSYPQVPLSTTNSQPGELPFTGQAELNVEALIEQVLARNPSLSQMIAAWQAASARYPQVTSLEDPMFAATVGPGTIAPDEPGVEFAYRLEVSQKLPFPGKL